MILRPNPRGLPWDGTPGRAYAWNALRDLAIQYFGANPSEVVSVKVRLDLHPERGPGRQALYAHGYDCTYAEEYERIYSQLATARALAAPHVGHAEMASIVGRPTKPLRLSDGSTALFVEHESGPEVVWLLVAAGSISLLKEIFGFLREAIKAINDRSKEAKILAADKEPNSPTLGIEVRVLLENKARTDSFQAKILAQREIPMNSSEDIDALLEESLAVLVSDLRISPSDDTESNG